MAFIAVLNPEIWKCYAKFGESDLNNNKSLIDYLYTLEITIGMLGCFLYFIAIQFFPASFVGEGLTVTKYLFCISLLFSTNSVFYALLRDAEMHLPVVFGNIISVAIKVLCVYFQRDELYVDYILSVFLVADLAKAVVIFYFGLQIYKKIHSSSDEFVFDEKFELKTFLFWITLPRIIHLPIQHLDRIIVGVFLGASELSIYYVIRKLAELFNRIITPITMLVAPLIMQYRRSNNYGALKALYLKVAGMNFAISASILSVVILTYQYWLGYFLTEEYFGLFFNFFIFSSCTFIFCHVYPALDMLGGEKVNTIMSVIVNGLFIFVLNSIGGFDLAQILLLVMILSTCSLMIKIAWLCGNSRRSLKVEI